MAREIPEIETLKLADDVYALRCWVPTPFGFLSISAHVVLGAEPTLIDTHMPLCRELFMAAAWKLVDPEDVRWVFITHDDRDHSGNLMQVLERCPKARFATSMIGMARMAEEFALPMDRLTIINAGEQLQANGRSFGMVRPITYDSPATLGIFDTKSTVLFSADSFGAFCPRPTNDAADLPAEDYDRGFGMFQASNSPWCHLLPDTRQLAEATGAIRSLGANVIASAHGPYAKGQTERLLTLVDASARLPPFKGPTHADFEAMLARLAAPAAT